MRTWHAHCYPSFFLSLFCIYRIPCLNYTKSTNVEFPPLAIESVSHRRGWRMGARNKWIKEGLIPKRKVQGLTWPFTSFLLSQCFLLSFKSTRYEVYSFSIWFSSYTIPTTTKYIHNFFFYINSLSWIFVDQFHEIIIQLNYVSLNYVITSFAHLLSQTSYNFGISFSPLDRLVALALQGLISDPDEAFGSFNLFSQWSKCMNVTVRRG